MLAICKRYSLPDTPHVDDDTISLLGCGAGELPDRIDIKLGFEPAKESN
jgi:hypothetical protein